MADRLELQRIASAFRVVGWGAFWSQLTLALVSAGVLAFNSIGGKIKYLTMTERNKVRTRASTAANTIIQIIGH